MTKPKARLRNWTQLSSGQLIGIVYDHPHQPDGELAVTTRVERMAVDRTQAETTNTVYILENEYKDPEPKYA